MKWTLDLRKISTCKFTYMRHFFSNDRFLNSVHKSSWDQTTQDLRKEKSSFLNRDLPVLPNLPWNRAVHFWCITIPCKALLCLFLSSLFNFTWLVLLSFGDLVTRQGQFYDIVNITFFLRKKIEKINLARQGTPPRTHFISGLNS